MGVVREWVYPEYSRSQVQRTGEILRTSDEPFNQIEAMEVLNNWKAAHELPMATILKTVKKYSNGISKKITIVQRRKRTESILLKLNQQPKLDLARMQDLVGFRIVFRNDDPKKNLAHIDELVEKISTSRMRSKVSRLTNYIEKPRDSGYRSVHAIFKYNSISYPKHNNMQVELQIRTKIQHSWATAVETVGMFERSHLKQGLGDKNWLEFFRIMSLLMSIEEGTHESNTEEKNDLKERLRNISKTINARENLRVIMLQNVVLERSYNDIRKKMRGDPGYMLVRLDRGALKTKLTETNDGKVKAKRSQPIEITGFPKNAELEATDEYSRMEKEAHENKDVFVLLAKAQDVKSLKNGFPNYFADISDFIKLHNNYCES
jgi:ppGpp synthetase/RelA/SpoT-type nucleotidyltranferase